MADRYPSWTGGPWASSTDGRGRRSIAEALRGDGGRVAGRYSRGRTRDLLEDASAVVEIEPAEPRPGHGDHITALLQPGPRPTLSEVQVLAPAGRELPPSLRDVVQRRPLLEQRAAALDAVREFFRARGFLEVETPTRVTNPGLEPHLRPFPAGVGADGRERYLITSPELHLKRLLAAGYERIFELARAFRDDESGDLHNPEFTLLEWYRSHAGLDDLATDIAELLPYLVDAVARVSGADRRTVRGCDLTAPPERATYADVFTRAAGVLPWELSADERDRRFVSVVEPALGRDRPLLIDEYPPDGCALARCVPSSGDCGWPSVAARMELYIGGVELANGFDELNDPDEQRRRHVADRAARERAGTATPPLDEGFLEALEAGMPPAAGIALGLDRLVMLLTGADRIADVRAFS